MKPQSVACYHLKDIKQHVHFVLFIMLCKVVRTGMKPHQNIIQIEATLQAICKVLVCFLLFLLTFQVQPKSRVTYTQLNLVSRLYSKIAGTRPVRIIMHLTLSTFSWNHTLIELYLIKYYIDFTLTELSHIFSNSEIPPEMSVVLGPGKSLARGQPQCGTILTFQAI